MATDAVTPAPAPAPTPAPTPATPAEMQALVQGRRNMTIALIWGGAMLGLLALWVKLKHVELTALAPVTLLVLAIGSVALALWLLRSGSATPTREALENQKRVVGRVMSAGGLLLLAMAAWLGFTLKVPAIGESLGMFLFGVLALATGFRNMSPGQSSQDTFFQTLTTKKDNVSTGLLILGLGVLFLGIWLRFRVHTESPSTTYPMWFGAILIGLIWVGSGAYLRVSTTLTATSMRFLILVVGGLSGFAIAFFTFCQAWIWRRDVFFAGPGGWNGDEGWRVWVCGYIALVGLALLFGSLLLARADIRVNPVLRRTLYGYNAALSGLLMLMFLVTLNIIVFVVYPTTYNWTEVQGRQSLSESSIDILQGLREPVIAYVLLPDNTKVYPDVRRLMDNCTGITNMITVKYISPDDPKQIQAYNEVAQKYPDKLPSVTKLERGQADSGRGILLVYGKEKESDKDPEPKRTMIPVDKIQETRPVPTRVGEKERAANAYVFTGESALLSELRLFVEGQKKVTVYVLQGNGEMLLSPRVFAQIRDNVDKQYLPLGIGQFCERLEKENLEIKGLSFDSPDAAPEKQPDLKIVFAPEKDKKKDVPEDCRVLIVAGPGKALDPQALDAIERYLDKGGRMLAMLGVVTDVKFTHIVDTGLERLLEKYGVEVTKTFAFRYPSNEPAASVALFSDETEHPVAKKFSRQRLPVLRETRVIKPLSQKGRHQAETVLLADNVDFELGLRGLTIWAESDVGIFKGGSTAILKYAKESAPSHVQDRKPLSIGVAVTEDGQPRLIVLGDPFLAGNFVMRSRFGDDYYDVMGSFVDWLAERRGIGARERNPTIFVVDPKFEQEWRRMTLLPGLCMVLGVIGLGLGTWVVRRR